MKILFFFMIIILVICFIINQKNMDEIFNSFLNKIEKLEKENLLLKKIITKQKEENQELLKEVITLRHKKREE